MNPQPSASTQFSPHSGLRKTLIIVSLFILLVVAVIFAVWAYKGRQEYKNDSDQKIAAAVAVSNKQLTAKLQAQFAQAEKSPFKVFHGSPTYGSISFNYPKTWSAYVDTTDSSEPINAYFYPDQVPGVSGDTAYALRIELVDDDYSQVLQQYSDDITQGNDTAVAYLPPKLKGVANAQPGTLISGQIDTQNQNQSGTMLAIKVRDKTLEIYTESNSYLSDFNNTILASLTFAP